MALTTAPLFQKKKTTALSKSLLPLPGGLGSILAPPPAPPMFTLPTISAPPFLGGSLPPSVTGGIGAHTPAPGGGNYQNLLASDPLYQQMLADAKAASAADLAARNAAIQRALISFGELPTYSGPSSLGFDLTGLVTPEIQQLIQQSTTSGLSTVARLAEQDKLAQRGIVNNLAGRGLIFSGDTGYRLGQEQQAYQRAQYDARQQLLDALMGIQGGYVSSERARQQALMSAAMQAFATQLALAQANAGAGTSAGGPGPAAAGGPGVKAAWGSLIPPFTQTGPPPIPMVTKYPLSRPIQNVLTGQPVRWW